MGRLPHYAFIILNVNNHKSVISQRKLIKSWSEQIFFPYWLNQVPYWPFLIRPLRMIHATTSSLRYKRDPKPFINMNRINLFLTWSGRPRVENLFPQKEEDLSQISQSATWQFFLKCRVNEKVPVGDIRCTCLSPFPAGSPAVVQPHSFAAACSASE